MFRLETIREELYGKRDNYFCASARAEKAEQMANIEDESDRAELAKKNAEEMRNAAVRSSENYLTSLAEEKQVWGDCEEYRKFCINTLKDSEESRIQFVKKMLEKHLQLECKLNSQLLEEAKSVVNVYSAISPSREASEFQLANLNISQVSREEWTPYEIWKKQMKDSGNDPLATTEAWISSDIPYVPMQSSLALMKTVIYYLIPVRRRESVDFRTEKGCINEIDDVAISQLVLLLNNPKFWMSFVQVIEFRKHVGLIDRVSMKKLQCLISTLLDQMMYEETFDYLVFYIIIVISHELFRIGQWKKISVLLFIHASCI